MTEIFAHKRSPLVCHKNTELTQMRVAQNKTATAAKKKGERNETELKLLSETEQKSNFRTMIFYLSFNCSHIHITRRCVVVVSKLLKKTCHTERKEKRSIYLRITVVLSFDQNLFDVSTTEITVVIRV